MVNIKCECGHWNLIRPYELIQEGLMVCREYKGRCKCGRDLRNWEVKVEDLEAQEFLN